LDATVRRISTLVRWIHMRQPKEEDGNNFGVGVQIQFLQRLAEYQKMCDDFQEEIVTYHFTRGEVLKKMTREESTETRKKWKGDELVGISESVRLAGKEQLHCGDFFVMLGRMDAQMYMKLRDSIEELITMHIYMWNYMK